MLDTEALTPQPDTSVPQVHSDDSRYDGSRTSPEVQYEIMRRHKSGMSMAAIADDCHCDSRTVKAVIQNWGTSSHRLRLEAYRSQVVDNVILGMKEAAERGKLDSILSLSDRLGLTDPPKGQQGPTVAVQVNLHGGPEPVSLAKVQVESEGLSNQAQSSEGLIMGLMVTKEVPQNQALTQSSVPQAEPPEGDR